MLEEEWCCWYCAGAHVNQDPSGAEGLSYPCVCQRLGLETSACEHQRLCFNDTFINTNADKKGKEHLDMRAITLTVPKDNKQLFFSLEKRNRST